MLCHTLFWNTDQSGGFTLMLGKARLRAGQISGFRERVLQASKGGYGKN